MNAKTYKNIKAVKRTGDDVELSFRPGDPAVIQEKIDGTNVQVSYNPTTDTIDAYTHHGNIITSENNHRGFYEYLQTINHAAFKDNSTYIFYGEWLVQHSIAYKPEYYNKWYLFDIYDTTEGYYLPKAQVAEIADKYNIPMVTTFYEGEFISWEHLREFVGKSDWAVNQGEGVVIKRQEKNTPFRGAESTLKIVRPDLQEARERNKTLKEKKPLTPEELEAQRIARAESKYLQEVVSTIVTRRRFNKLVLEYFDENNINDRTAWFNTADPSTLMKFIPKAMMEDCIKEEPNTVNEVGKQFGKISVTLVKTYIKDLFKNPDSLDEG